MKETVILKYLLENKEEHNIRSIAEAVKMDYKNVYQIIKRLESSVLTIKKFGKSNRVILEQKNHPLLFKAEFERSQNLNKDLKVIQKHLEGINYPFIALLFGSQAKGRVSKSSDIDLMFISEKNFESTLTIFPLNIHATTITAKEFIQMVRSKEFTVVSEAIKNNIILVGIEDYYRLLENAYRTTN
jgi:predicted nucleotidyltransferase